MFYLAEDYYADWPGPEIANIVKTSKARPGENLNIAVLQDSVYGPGKIWTPNKPEKPIGENNGEVGDEYKYTTRTYDPNGDQIYYLFSWGDGTDSGWLGPYNSGSICEATHSWGLGGAYVIKAKAMDELGFESEWSELLPYCNAKKQSSTNTFP